MKILSKYKDYYDYLSGIYGVDEKIILDRREFMNPAYKNEGKIILVICDILYEGYCDGSNYYWGDDVKQLGVVKPEVRWKFMSNRDGEHVNINRPGKNEVISIFLEPILLTKSPNKELNCPILFSYYIRENYRKIDLLEIDYFKYPKLSDLGVQRILPAQDIYLKFTEWLSPKDNVITNQTDKEKILANGFDVKSSFRNIK